MRTEKVFRVGRLTIDGEIIEFRAEGPHTYEADRRDDISLGVAYEYTEVSKDKEDTRIRISAHLDGQKPETTEAHIRDNPALDDSRRGFVSVPLRPSKAGEVRGRFTIEAHYASGPWKGEPDRQANERVDGEFVLRVK